MFIQQWLEDGFLGYLDRWESSVHERESSVHERQSFTPAERELMLLSRETREGFWYLLIKIHAVH